MPMIDQVDVGLGAQRLPVVGDPGDSPPLGEGVRTIDLMAGDTDHIDLDEPGRRVGVHVGDESVADDHGAQRPRRHARGSVSVKSNASLASDAVSSRRSATPTSRPSWWE